MAAIGFVNGTPDKGFVGQLKTLSIRASIEIRPNGSKSNGDAEAAPDAAETAVEGGAEAPARATRRGRPKAAQAAAS